MGESCSLSIAKGWSPVESQWGEKLYAFLASREIKPDSSLLWFTWLREIWALTRDLYTEHKGVSENHWHLTNHNLENQEPNSGCWMFGSAQYWDLFWKHAWETPLLSQRMDLITHTQGCSLIHRLMLSPILNMIYWQVVQQAVHTITKDTRISPYLYDARLKGTEQEIQIKNLSPH